MHFHLDLNAGKITPSFYFRDKMLLCGSCFAEEIGTKLGDHCFNAVTNPHGILFNPLSISNALQAYLNNKKYTASDLIPNGDLWFSREHHGKFSSTDPDYLLKLINQHVEEGSRFLLEGDLLILTFGTSDGWFYRDTGQVAGNCHKLPRSGFSKSTIPYTTSVNHLSILFKKLFEVNPRIRVILTVSPVRYLKEGMLSNSLSKAHLFLMVAELLRQFDRVIYFPAYELVIDDLRDYRFYKPDLVHPDKQAVDYVWEKFLHAGLSADDFPVLQEVKEYLALSSHRVLHPGTSEAEKFLKLKETKKQQLLKAYPFLRFKEEISC